MTSSSSGGASSSSSGGGVSFACGTGLTCDRRTQYCYHFASSLALGDAGANYSCQSLPSCDAADPCSCLVASGLDSCSCSYSGGWTRTCMCTVCSQ
jgi:hypothetical protein